MSKTKALLWLSIIALFVACTSVQATNQTAFTECLSGFPTPSRLDARDWVKRVYGRNTRILSSRNLGGGYRRVVTMTKDGHRDKKNLYCKAK